MKKRVAKSEIELARKSSRVIFVIFFILLVFLFMGFGVLYALDIDFTSYIHIPQKEAQVSDTKKTIKKGIISDPPPMAVDVDINDSNVQTFYRVVKVTNEDVCIEGGYREKDHVVVSSLSTKCKFSIASKIYENNVEAGLDGKLSVKESAVKDAYESIFGTGTYEKQESIPCLYHTNFIYHGDYYFTEKVTPEEGTSLTSYEKILYALRQGEKLDIVTVVVYYEHVLSMLCKDSRCENTVTSLKKDVEYGEEYLSLYVEHNKDSLYQYTYHFEMDSAGFYRYVGYDRTNE